MCSWDGLSLAWTSSPVTPSIAAAATDRACTSSPTLVRGAGFLFAWLLPFCANYGVTDRLNEALATGGSGHRESPWLVFWLTGWPFIGSKKRIRRAVDYLNDAHRVRQGAAA
jgi:hypothetical protein